MKQLWSLNIILMVFINAIFFGCEKDREIEAELSGIWIEHTHKNDTIDFDFWVSENIFILKRGFELSNDNILPKYGSGPYNYIRKPDSLLIRSMFSSCICYSSYPFQLNSSKDSFEIGNFYDTTMTKDKHIKFYKVK